MCNLRRALLNFFAHFRSTVAPTHTTQTHAENAEAVKQISTQRSTWGERRMRSTGTDAAARSQRLEHIISGEMAKCFRSKYSICVKIINSLRTSFHRTILMHEWHLGMWKLDTSNYIFLHYVLEKDGKSVLKGIQFCCISLHFHKFSLKRQRISGGWFYSFVVF